MRVLFAFLLSIQSVYGFWPFDGLFGNKRDPLPAYALVHPQMDTHSVYGVGDGESFLEAKSKALNDIATQLSCDVRSITSVHKESETGTTSDQQITVLTKRQIENYVIRNEAQANGRIYLLIEYKR